MSRYIDADNLKNAKRLIADNPYVEGWNDAIDAIVEYAPTADVVEVVRCKYCKHFHEGIYNGEYWMECDEYKIALSSDNWFCADGKR